MTSRPAQPIGFSPETFNKLEEVLHFMWNAHHPARLPTRFGLMKRVLKFKQGVNGLEIANHDTTFKVPHFVEFKSDTQFKVGKNLFISVGKTYDGDDRISVIFKLRGKSFIEFSNGTFYVQFNDQFWSKKDIQQILDVVSLIASLSESSTEVIFYLKQKSGRLQSQIQAETKKAKNAPWTFGGFVQSSEYTYGIGPSEAVIPFTEAVSSSSSASGSGSGTQSRSTRGSRSRSSTSR